ncbi:uncharacterized protein LOC113332890 [Papaver somniferum]|uniref:uncharacterized protein LOC113332890 n=1 Tax=Papaver somniferum TaxID=3469 RepID=UPI000E6FF966|nr:uncharacterized protein LOC113332890 [Papaver somniferum]
MARAKSMLFTSHGNTPLNRIATIEENHRESSHWKSPPESWIQFNTYGSWNPNSSNEGMGLIICDSKHSFILAESTDLVCLSAEEAEVQAIRETLRITLIMKDEKVIVEGDAAGIIDQINKKSFLGDLRTHLLFEDIRTLSLKFKFLSFVYVNRLGTMYLMNWHNGVKKMPTMWC